MPKFFGFSKTFLVNAGATVVAIVTAVSNQEWVADNPEYTAFAAAALGLANVFLRFVTDRPVKLTP